MSFRKKVSIVPDILLPADIVIISIRMLPVYKYLAYVLKSDYSEYSVIEGSGNIIHID